MKRRKFTKEFKSQLIKEAIETGNSGVVGRKHNISPSVVSRWVRKHNGDPMARMTQKAVESDNVDLLAKARKSNKKNTKKKKAMESNHDQRSLTSLSRVLFASFWGNTSKQHAFYPLQL